MLIPITYARSTSHIAFWASHGSIAAAANAATAGDAQNGSTCRHIATLPSSNRFIRWSRLPVFNYNPDDETTFDVWYKRYEHVIDDRGQALSEERNLLMDKLEKATYKTYRKHVLPFTPKDVDLPHRGLGKVMKKKFEDTLMWLAELLSHLVSQTRNISIFASSPEPSQHQRELFRTIVEFLQYPMFTSTNFVTMLVFPSLPYLNFMPHFFSLIKLAGNSTIVKGGGT